MLTANEGIVHLLYHSQHKKNKGKINKTARKIIRQVMAAFEALSLDPKIVILAYFIL